MNNKNLYCKGCIRCEAVMDSETMIADGLHYIMYFNSYGRTDDARRFFRELPEHARKGLAARDYSHAIRVFVILGK